MYKQWDVWYYDQVLSRINSDPRQPIDPSGKTRMYVIVCPQAHLDSGGHPVCVPIGTKQQSSLIDAEIKAGEGGIDHDSWIWCSEIYTLDSKYFKQKMGSVPGYVQADIRDGLRTFFDL
jgi:mRNA-degrading endonuclease toxin of MazEF toxin-antitoxin module